MLALGNLTDEGLSLVKGEKVMRVSRFLMVGVAVLFSAGLAVANPADVNFGIKDPPCSPSSCTLITSSTFSFTMPDVPAGKTVNLLFENSSSNVTLSSLDLDLFTGLSVTPSLFNCTIDAFFNTCKVTQIKSSIAGDNEYQVLLENLGPLVSCTPDGDNDADDKCGGILPGETFALQFTNPGGTNTALDWAGEDLTVNVSTTPEPGTLVLLASGLLPFWSLRKRLLS